MTAADCQYRLRVSGIGVLNRHRDMSIGHRSRNRRSVEGRRCPDCGRGMALVDAIVDLNDERRSVRYCRWARDEKCALTLDEAKRRRVGRLAADNGSITTQQEARRA